MNNPVLTSDGSYTLYNSDFSEHYHSTTGAYQEALEKYIIPLQIEDGFKILDFCFGLGYNSFVALSMYSNLEIIALENNIKIINKISEFPYPDKLMNVVKIYKDLHNRNFIKDDKNNSIKLILDDAKKSVANLPDEFFHRVFFDPFSPKKAPDLWTKEIFKQIYRTLKKSGKLATYSCDKKIRRNMEEAGFLVIDGPNVGRKSPSTIAIKE